MEENKNIVIQEETKKKEASYHCFEVVSDTEHLNEETIIKALNHKTIKRWAYILHDKDFKDEEHKEPKNPHWHIIMSCPITALPISTISKWFNVPSNFVEVKNGRGAFLDCVEYLTHEDEKQIELGKYRYPDEDVKANFEWRYELDNRNECREKYGVDSLSIKQQLRIWVMNGTKTLKEIKESFPLEWADDLDKLQKLRLNYLYTCPPPSTRLNFYMSGVGGIGKGLISRALARMLFPDVPDEDLFFEIGAKGCSFEGYDGQPVIIWNDFRAYDLLNVLNGRGNVFNVFDTHPSKSRQNIKYGSVNLINTINIVNSVEPYVDFLNGLCGQYTDKNGLLHESEDRNQGYRRMPFIFNLREEDFDFLVNRGFIENNRQFLEYLEYNHIRGNMQKLVLYCKGNEQLAQPYANKMLSIPKREYDKVNEMMDKMEDNQNEFESYLETLGTQDTLDGFVGVKDTTNLFNYLEG